MDFDGEAESGVETDGVGNSIVRVPEKRCRVRERETGRTANRGRGKFMTTRVERDSETLSV